MQMTEAELVQINDSQKSDSKAGGSQGPRKQVTRLKVLA